MRSRNPVGGFTLIELMIVVGIVAVLAAIAYPAYTQFVMQGNRTDATKTLQLAAQGLERCYSVNFTYLPPGGCTVNGNVVNNGSTMQSPNLFYTITFNIPDAQDYSLVAVPVAAPQTNDTQCVLFTLLSSGQQTAQNNLAGNTTQTCWGSN
jgi:type IV pilus assembly protein PilE